MPDALPVGDDPVESWLSRGAQASTEKSMMTVEQIDGLLAAAGLLRWACSHG